MKQNTILIAVIALLIGVIGGYALTKEDDRYEMGDMMSNQFESRDIDDMPMGNMGHSMMAISSEREFLTGMIPHHQEAVDTAKDVIERGGSTPEIKNLAENIVVAQEKEIAEMKEWYQNWYGVAYEEKSADYKPMMRELSNLSGAELDKIFLEDMIVHHMGAIMMAKSVQAHIEHEEITNLTKAIAETQSAEISLMRDFLTSL